MPEEKSFDKIPLQSNDGSIITVDYDVAIRSTLLSTMLEDLKSMGVAELGPVPLPNVRHHSLLQVSVVRRALCRVPID